jgi:antitoxin MazE
MDTVISKWGNSLGIRIPKLLAKELHLKNGSRVDIIIDNKKIIIRPKQNISINDILSKINKKNIHNEIKFGIPEGNETI